MGGAGPAIAAVPLTVVWVGGSFVSLLGGIGAGKVGPVGAAQRVGYVFFMSVAQVGNPEMLLPALKEPSCLPLQETGNKDSAVRATFEADIGILLPAQVPACKTERHNTYFPNDTPDCAACMQ